MTQSARNRIPYRAYTTAGQGQIIAVDQVLPFNATLLQVLIVYSGLPAVGDVVGFGKNSAVDIRLNFFPIRTFLVGANGWERVICNEHFEFFKGDSLVATAGNGNNLSIGFEAIFGEAG